MEFPNHARKPLNNSPFSTNLTQRYIIAYTETSCPLQSHHFSRRLEAASPRRVSISRQIGSPNDGHLSPSISGGPPHYRPLLESGTRTQNFATAAVGSRFFRAALLDSRYDERACNNADSTAGGTPERRSSAKVEGNLMAECVRE